MPGHERPFAPVVRRATRGDEEAWRCLVEHFTPTLRRIARGFRLAPHDVDDVVQLTWARAFSRIGALEQPEAIGAWLAVTARREALRHLQRAIPEVLTDTPADAAHADHRCPADELLDAERRVAVRAAVRRLPERQRRLLSALLATPWCSYENLSRALAMPVGSIGPTRIRSIDRLRADSELASVVTA